MPASSAPSPATARVRTSSESPAAARRARIDGTHQLVLGHLGLAEAIAHRFSGASPDWLDIRQVAYLGLVTAAHRFDPTRGHDFVSFASPTIVGAVKHHLRDHGWFVRPPRAVQELHSDIIATLPALTQELGRHPDAGDLAGALERSRSDVAEAIASDSAFHPLSLDLDLNSLQESPAGHRRSTALHESIGVLDPAYERVEARLHVLRMCSTLPERERRALVLRYGFQRSQSDIAAELGVSQMHVSRILTRTLSRLRNAEESSMAPPVQEPAAVSTVPGS